MFDDLGYHTIFEHGALKILYGGLIIAKGSRIYGLYIWEGSNVIFHSWSASEDFHDNEMLWDWGQDMLDS